MSATAQLIALRTHGPCGITGSMLRSMHRLFRVVGTTGVDLNEGVNVKMAIHPNQGWRDRLQQIHELVTTLTDDQGERLEYLARLLKYDGWSLTRGRMKTPSWMRDCAEVLFSELPEEFQWVVQCESETTSRHLA